MDSETREYFRRSLLSLIGASEEIGQKTPSLAINLRTEGYTFTDADLSNELDYLKGKGLIAPKDKIISPENRRWRLTTEGIAFCDREGISL
jgi:hypothetical protein